MAAEPPGRPRSATLRPHRSYLAYQNHRYLKLALAVCGAAIASYVFYEPRFGHSGNTWLGYTLGTLGLLLIFWLAWYGVRKRKFRNGRGVMQAWTSAHVYLGLSLLVVATLHTGFQFGWNIHTVAYGLMVLVILSGVYGIFMYGTIPAQITANRQQTSPEVMQAEIARLDQTALRLADRIDEEAHQVVARSVGKVVIGGNFVQQLLGRYSRANRRQRSVNDFVAQRLGKLTEGAPAVPAKPRRDTTLFFVSDQIFDAAQTGKAEDLQKLLAALSQRKLLVDRLNLDITHRARLRIWFFIHVPMSVALLFALAVHVFSTFYYW